MRRVEVQERSENNKRRIVPELLRRDFYQNHVNANSGDKSVSIERGEKKRQEFKERNYGVFRWGGELSALTH